MSAPGHAKANTLVLVGCGQMGSAMLRGWLARGAAERFMVVEPAGAPATLAEAAGVAWPNPRVSAAQRGLADALLAAIGESAWVEDEVLMDAVTAVSGSGPAYVF